MLTGTSSEGGGDGWSSLSGGRSSTGGSWDDLGGWDNTWSSDGQGSWASNGDSGWLTDGVTLGDGDNGSVWAVGGVTGNSDVRNDSGVNVSSQTGGGQSRDSSDSRELHWSE